MQRPRKKCEHREPGLDTVRHVILIGFYGNDEFVWAKVPFSFVCILHEFFVSWIVFAGIILQSDFFNYLELGGCGTVEFDYGKYWEVLRNFLNYC